VDIDESYEDEKLVVEPAPVPVRRFSWWWLSSALAAGLVFGIGLLFSLRLLARPLALLIIAVAIATSVAPLVQRLTDRYRISRTLVAGLVFLVVILFFAAIGSMLAPGLAAQAGALTDRIPSLIEMASESLDRWNLANQTSLVETLFSQASMFTTGLVALPFRIFSSLLDILLILFIALYWLILMPSMRAFILSLFPERRQQRLDSLMGEIGQAMGGYVRGTLINAVIVGLLTYIGLLIIGVDYPGVLGLLAGVLEIIPILGPIIAGVVIIAFALLESPTTALIAGIYVLVMQQVESNVLVPNVMRREADVSPLLVLIAVYVGGTLGGLTWALASIPLMAALTVLFKQVLAPIIRRNTGAAPTED